MLMEARVVLRCASRGFQLIAMDLWVALTISVRRGQPRRRLQEQAVAALAPLQVLRLLVPLLIRRHLSLVRVAKRH